MPIDLSPDIRAAHADLSPVALDFLEYLAEDPDARARASSWPEPPAWLRAVSYPLQPWPTFIDARKVAQLERAVAGVMQLVKAVPQRIFGGDAAALARYCELEGGPFAAYGGLTGEQLAAYLFEPPNGLPGVFARCDFIDTVDGPKCLEVNTGKIGGWQQRFWEEHIRAAPLIADFFARRGVHAVARDPWRELLRHAVELVRATPLGDGGEINVVLALGEADYRQMGGAVAGGMEVTYRAVLAERGEGLAGRAACAPYPDGLTVDGDLRVHHQGVPVHAVIENTHRLTPWPLYQVFKAGRIQLLSGPLHRVVADKRNLALLSEHGHSDRFSAEERSAIADFIPWTRTVEDRTVVYRGEELPLRDLLVRDRGSFVLKPARGLQGTGVVVGRRVTAEVWEQAVAAAVADGFFIAQEWQVSRPHLCQSGEVGGIPHDVIWGLFCFGSRYGGGFLRQMPCGQGDGIINSERGAVEGFLFEV